MKQAVYKFTPGLDLDGQIIELLKYSLPICERPYLIVAKQLDMGESALILRIHHLMREQQALLSHVFTYTLTGSLESEESTMLSSWDKRLIHTLQKGLPLSSRPFHIIAKQEGLSLDEVLFRAERLRQKGYIQRIRPGFPRK